jgi:hypothetical protein
MRFGVIAATSTPQVKMGLYSDSGGNPNTLLAQIPATNLVVGNLEVPTTQINLAPGNYWLMAVYNVTGTPYQDNATTNTYKYTSLPFANALPSTFPPPAVQMATIHFNYYIVVAQ